MVITLPMLKEQAFSDEESIGIGTYAGFPLFVLRQCVYRAAAVLDLAM